ncbi:MAG TPA: hypothetical protein DFR83_13740, partial [Deltaproteobacteria bacterium]|nr:hypothetical protein [Deltaproteobacteria bacterium]
MSPYEPPSSPLDPAGSDGELDPDATMFIRISDARRHCAQGASPAMGSARLPPPPPAAPRSSPTPRAAWCAPPGQPPVSALSPVTAHGSACSGLGTGHPASSMPAAGRHSPFRVPDGSSAPTVQPVAIDHRLHAVVMMCCATVCAVLATLVSAVMDPLSPGLPQSPPSGWAQPAIAVDGADHDTGDGAWEGAVEVSTRSEPAPAGLSATVERVASEVVRPAAAGSGG